MFNEHFYWGHTKKIIACFGSIFSNIQVARTDGSKVTSLIRVPINYGPAQKWLIRINEEPGLVDRPAEVAIRLPRMSFEITGLSIDSGKMLNKKNRLMVGLTDGGTAEIRPSVPYRMNLQLNVYAKNADDALQVVEQILPSFGPEYTVTIRNLEGTNNTTDVPFILNGVSLSDEYEGDATTRRLIVYTLDFEVKFSYHGAMMKPVNLISVIASTSVGSTPPENPGIHEGGAVHVNLYNNSNHDEYFETIHVGPNNLSPNDRVDISSKPEVVKVAIVDYIQRLNVVSITVGTVVGGTLLVGNNVYGSLSATVGTITAVSGNVLTISSVDGIFVTNDFIVNNTTHAYAPIVSINTV